VPNEQHIFLLENEIVRLAIEACLPSVFGIQAATLSRGFCGLLSSYIDIFRRAASMWTRFSRVPSRRLPVEQPTKFELVINLRPPRPRPDDPAVAAGAGG
jgi:hypothetical protein